MKVAKIEYAGKMDVFNMEVEDVHCFEANGFVVHNCYDDVRYMCMARPIAARESKFKSPAAYDPFGEVFR